MAWLWYFDVLRTSLPLLLFQQHYAVFILTIIICCPSRRVVLLWIIQSINVRISRCGKRCSASSEWLVKFSLLLSYSSSPSRLMCFCGWSAFRLVLKLFSVLINFSFEKLYDLICPSHMDKKKRTHTHSQILVICRRKQALRLVILRYDFLAIKHAHNNTSHGSKPSPNVSNVTRNEQFQ